MFMIKSMIARENTGLVESITYTCEYIIVRENTEQYTSAKSNTQVQRTIYECKEQYTRAKNNTLCRTSAGFRHVDPWTVSLWRPICNQVHIQIFFSKCINKKLICWPAVFTVNMLLVDFRRYCMTFT